jgi:hypothetical protein
MKNIMRASLLASACLLATFSMAHDDHGGHAFPLNPKTALQHSIHTIEKLVKAPEKLANNEAGKLPVSWLSLTTDAAKIAKNGRGFYVVAVSNPEENKTTFIKMSLNADILGVNFSGNFDDDVPSAEQDSHDHHHH